MNYYFFLALQPSVSFYLLYDHVHKQLCYKVSYFEASFQKFSFCIKNIVVFFYSASKRKICYDNGKYVAHSVFPPTRVLVLSQDSVLRLGNEAQDPGVRAARRAASLPPLLIFGRRQPLAGPSETRR